VPYLDNEAWVESLNQPVVKPWTAWSTPNSQIGGYVTQYSQITFATVRGAGHMVPQTRPVSSQAQRKGRSGHASVSPATPLPFSPPPSPQAAGLAVFNSLITGVPLA